MIIFASSVRFLNRTGAEKQGIGWKEIGALYCKETKKYRKCPALETYHFSFSLHMLCVQRGSCVREAELGCHLALLPNPLVPRAQEEIRQFNPLVPDAHYTERQEFRAGHFRYF